MLYRNVFDHLEVGAMQYQLKIKNKVSWQLVSIILNVRKKIFILIYFHIL